MKASSVSSQAISQALRYQMLRMQVDLVKAQKESSTGRIADVGLSLGARTGQSVSLARDVERLGNLVDTNALASSRLSATQDVLLQLSDRAQTFLSTLNAAMSGDASPTVTQADGAATLRSLTSLVNASHNGEYIMAGTNTDVRPLNDYFATGSPSRAAFDAAFVSHFGFDKNDAAAASITASAMNDFIANVVEPMFLGAGWNGAWSNATDQTITSRIALNETAQTSVSANEIGVRKLAMAATLVTDLMASSNLNIDATRAIAERGVILVSGSIAEIADTQATTGIAQQRVARASERLTLQIDLFERHVQVMEGVAPYEAATRVSDLLAQIELSYALTARFQQLSLVKFLT